MVNVHENLVIYNINTSPGVRVIIDHLKDTFKKHGILLGEEKNCDNPDSIYIPYGPKCAYICAKRNRKVLFDLMVDYYSLGCKNRAISIFKNGYFFSKIFWKEFLAFILYYNRERLIYNKLDDHFLVSYNDILRLKERYPHANCYYVANGCSIPSIEISKVASDKIRLGVLSNWTTGTLADVRWFIEGYLPKIKKEIPNVEFYIAGKCEQESIVEYFNKCEAKYLGWVDSLEEYFSNLDIYVATVPKGCGVLNKVLDAFAHKTFTIGHKRAFSGFYGLENGYVSCETVSDYVRAIKLYKNQDPYVDTVINNAYQYVRTNNNWERNYEKFVSELIKDRNL